MKLPKLQSINSLPVLYFSADTKSNWGRQENNQMLDHHICLCVDVRTKKEIQRVKGWDRRNNNNNNKKKKWQGVWEWCQFSYSNGAFKCRDDLALSELIGAGARMRSMQACRPAAALVTACRTPGIVCIIQWRWQTHCPDLWVCYQGFSCGALRWKGAETKGSTALTSEVHEWRGPTGTDATAACLLTLDTTLWAATGCWGTGPS